MIDPVETFKTESLENLNSLELALLELDACPDNKELLDTAFRAMHTIKGAAGMFGYQELTEFTHYLENALDKVRSGQLQLNKTLIGILLDAKDCIEDSIGNPKFDSHQKIVTSRLLTRLDDFIPASEIAQESVAQMSAKHERSDEAKAYRIRFTPDIDSFRLGLDVIPILRELHGLGECQVTTITKNLPSKEQFVAENVYLKWDVILSSRCSQSDVEDVFMFVKDDWSINIEQIDLEDDDETSDRLGELLIDRGLLNSAQLQTVLSNRPIIGQQLSQTGVTSNEDVEAAVNEQSFLRNIKKGQQGVQDSTVRVPATRLDSLMNLVGELVIVQARLSQFAYNESSDELLTISEELERLTTQMRDETFSIRMIPIGTTFGRFKRLVRDLSVELKKNIQLVTRGAETELDKMVIDKLSDPLIHLIRNSLDHGIESSGERLAKNKPEQGTVVLSAEHNESHVVIKIIDDGRGLDTQKIRSKAIERNLITAEAELSEDNIYKLIFEPGFSTSDTVSDISGRGVGMDVVKRSIQELGGTISISSSADVGTEFTVRLPLTLAIIEGLMVEVGRESYVLPLSVVEECIELKNSGSALRSKKRLVEVRGQQIPFLYLRECFDIAQPPPKIEQIVITKIGQERFGFCVDEVIGQYQTVIKRLGKMYEGVTGFSGATILGDGSVAMILDPTALMEVAGATGNKLQQQITFTN